MRDTIDRQRGRKPQGKHPEKRLTLFKIRNSNEPGRYADGNGLYLVVEDSGAKRWILRTVVHGKRRDLGLGSLRLVSLAEARDEATRLRKTARAGGDPLAQRRRERLKVPTFKEAACQVHKAHSAAFRNAVHAAQWLSSLESYAFPVFGERLVSAIDSSDVLRALSPIWATKLETARRIKQRIKVIFDWAKASGYGRGLRHVLRPTDQSPQRSTQSIVGPKRLVSEIVHFWRACITSFSRASNEP